MDCTPIVGHLSLKDLDFIATNAGKYAEYFAASNYPELSDFWFWNKQTETVITSGCNSQDLVVKTIKLMRLRQPRGGLLSSSYDPTTHDYLWSIKMTYKEVFVGSYDALDTVQLKNNEPEGSWRYKTVKFACDRAIGISLGRDPSLKDARFERADGKSAAKIAFQLQSVKSMIEYLDMATVDLVSWTQQGLDAIGYCSHGDECINSGEDIEISNWRLKGYLAEGRTLEELENAIECEGCGECLFRMIPVPPREARVAK